MELTAGTDALANWLADRSRPAPVVVDVRSAVERTVSVIPGSLAANDGAEVRIDFGARKAALKHVARNYATGFRVNGPLNLYLKRAIGTNLEHAVELSNDPRFYRAVIPAGNGIATADDACRFFQCLLDGGRRAGAVGDVDEPRVLGGEVALLLRLGGVGARAVVDARHQRLEPLAHGGVLQVAAPTEELLRDGELPHPDHDPPEPSGEEVPELGRLVGVHDRHVQKRPNLFPHDLEDERHSSGLGPEQMAVG